MSGQLLLDDALIKAITLGDDLNGVSLMYEDMASRFETFVSQEAESGMVATIFLIFLKDANNFAPFATETLDAIRRLNVDISSMHEVEFLILLAAINQLMAAADLAKRFATDRDQVAAMMSLFSNPKDRRRPVADQIVAFGDLARSIKLHRGLKSPDYVTGFLERRIRSEISQDIVDRGSIAFANLKAKQRH